MSSRNPDVRRAWYLKNRERILADLKLKRAANPEKYRLAKKISRMKNLENELKRGKSEYYRNREARLAKAKADYAANPQLFRERQQHYRSVKRAMGMVR